MFLDANMSNEVEQKLKENFPNSKKSISKKHVTILILVTMTKTHEEHKNGFVIVFASNNASLFDVLSNHRLLLRIANKSQQIKKGRYLDFWPWYNYIC